MKLKNRRGISGVVTTVFIIVFAIIAVGILAGVVINMVRDSAGDVESRSACLDSNLQIESVDVNSNAVKISRGSGQVELRDIMVIVDSGDSANKSSVGGGLESLESLTHNYTGNISEGDKVSVAPVVEASGGGDYECDPVDTITANA